jgi:hypothetical protein
MNHLSDPHRVPPDLESWRWRLQQVKSGPRRHPGGWWQIVYWRWKGLAVGDDALEHGDPVLRVRVRRPTHDDAFAAAIAEMRDRSRTLVRHLDYDARRVEPDSMEEVSREFAARAHPPLMRDPEVLAGDGIFPTKNRNDSSGESR